MQDTLSAMREFRFLEDKRNGGGLTPSEEGRWQELATQLQQAPAVPQSVDPVVYAQELIAQGHDPVQAFLHVGFSLEQIAASGYDGSAHCAGLRRGDGVHGSGSARARGGRSRGVSRGRGGSGG